MGQVISKDIKDISFTPREEKEREKTCVICGNLFLPPGRNTKACSKKCQEVLRTRTQKIYYALRMSGKWKRKIKKRRYKPKVCIRCNEVFTPKTGNQTACCRPYFPS